MLGSYSLQGLKGSGQVREYTDEVIKSFKKRLHVIPAQAGIQYSRAVAAWLSSGLRRSDGVGNLRKPEYIFEKANGQL